MPTPTFKTGLVNLGICRHIPLRYLLAGISGKYLSFTEIHKWQDGTECAIEDYAIYRENNMLGTEMGCFEVKDMFYGTCWSKNILSAARWENEAYKYDFLGDTEEKYSNDYELIKKLVNRPILNPRILEELPKEGLVERILDCSVSIVTTTLQLKHMLSNGLHAKGTYYTPVGSN